MYGQIFLFCLIALGLVGLGSGPPAAHAAGSACEISADHPLFGEPRWYGLYFDGDKIGHAMTVMKAEASDSTGTDPPAIAQQFSMTFKLEQTEETIEQLRRFDRRPPHQLIDGSFKTADRHITYEQQRGDLHLREDGLARVWYDLERDLCDEENIAVHRFLAGGPLTGAELETTDFDVEHQVLTVATHQLQQTGTRKILGADHVFQTLHSESSSDTFSYVATTRFQNGEAVNLFLGPIELRAETEAIAHEPNQGVNLFAEFEKPLHRPLARLQAIDVLTLKARIDDPALTIDQVISDGFGQRIDYLDDQTAIVRIADAPAPEDDIETENFLKPTSSHPADHPRLKAIAASIVDELSPAAGNSERALAEAILDFVADYIETVPESPYVYHTTSVLDVLDNRTGDCTEHSQLFVTLARAAGLPAREVSGFVYSGDDSMPALSGHAWVEVLIDGQWVGMDPTWRETRLNRSHVQTRNALVPSLAFEVLDITYN